MIYNWTVAHKFWSIRIALLWAIVMGLYMALPAFQGMISPWWFLALCIGFSLAIVVARITHQPGIE